MSFRPAVFQLPTSPFCSRLRVRYGTDGRTNGQTDDGHHRFMPPYGGGAYQDYHAESVWRSCISRAFIAVVSYRARSRFYDFFPAN